MLRHYVGGADRPPTPAENIQLPQANQAANGPNENFRNPSREVEHQRDLLKDCFNNLHRVALGGQDLRRLQDVIYQSFSGLTNFSKNFYIKNVTKELS